MYNRIISQLYDTPLFLAEVKADAIAKAVTASLFSGTLRFEDFDPSAAPVNMEAYEGVSKKAEAHKTQIIYVTDAISTRAAPGSSSSGTSYSSINSQINEAKNAGVTKLGFIHHSPGGAAAGMTALTSRIRGLPAEGIETFSFVEGSASSASYGLAAATQKIYVTESSIVGSIGTLIIHADQSKADEQDGVSYEIFRSKPEKALGDPHSPLSDKARADIMAKLTEFDRIFNTDVNMSRPQLTVEQIIAFSGKAFMGNEAVDLGLADQIVANFEEVLQLEIFKSSSPSSNTGAKMADTADKGAINETAPVMTEETVATAVNAAVSAETSRVTEILATAIALRLESSIAQKHVEKGYSAEMSKEIMTEIAEARQPSIDNTVEKSGVTDEDGNTSVDNVNTLLSSYGAAVGQTFGGKA